MYVTNNIVICKVTYCKIVFVHTKKAYGVEEVEVYPFLFMAEDGRSMISCMP